MSSDRHRSRGVRDLGPAGRTMNCMKLTCRWIPVGALLLAAAGPADAPPAVEKDGYRIEWTSVSWQGDVSLPGGKKGWEASLSGMLSGPADREVIAYVTEVTEVLDAQGRSLLPSDYQKRWSEERRQRRRDQQVRRVMGRKGEGGVLGQVELALGGGQIAAPRIAKARGAVYVMEVTQSHALDLPLEPPRQWRQAIDGVRFRIESVEARGNQSIVTLSHTLDEEAAGGSDLTRPPYLYFVAAVDAQGQELPGVNAGFQNRGDAQVIVNVFSQTGQAVRPHALRLRVATEVQERKIDFELTDIDLALGRKSPPEGQDK
jgi:hypothetical protein